MGITSLGIGSGLDSESIVTQLTALQRQPITALQTKASAIQTKISTYGNIKSAVSSLQTSVQALSNASLWSATKASSADSTSVAAATTTGATPGTYNVSVSQLAASQSVVTKTALASSGATVGAGTLNISLGAWSGNSFAQKAGSAAINIQVVASDTLADIRDKINSSSAGVSASIINDASGARLVIQSKETGAANGFRIAAADSDGNNVDGAGLSALAYAPDLSTTGTQQTQQATNSKAAINGVAVESPTNALNEVVSGLSLNLNKITTTPVSIAVAQDSESITKAITEFASAYTKLSSMLMENTKYDAGSKTAGTLQGDSTALSILNQFRSLITANSGSSTVFANLSAIGLEVQTGGGLNVNSTKLQAALSSNLGEVKKLFANADLSDDSKDGIATRLNMLTTSMLSFDGVFATRTQGLQSSVKNNESQQARLNERATQYEKLLRAQYAALDQQMASISSQGNYVTQMINTLNSSSSK